MRLLTVGSLPPEWGGPVRGGVATFHAALLTALSERRAEIEVVGTVPPTPLDREIPVPAWIRPEEVSRATFYQELLERLRPDVVLMSHIAHTIGVTHARLDSPAPAIGAVQSWHNVTFRSGEERQGAIEVTEEALSGLRAIATPSRHTLEEGSRLGFEYPPIAEAIHNPVPPLFMTDDVDVATRERGGVLYLGSLIPRKNPSALVEAAVLLPGLDVMLVGKGELEEELRTEIAALGLEDRVVLARLPGGDGHPRQVRELLLGSHAMCLPSRSEGLPLAFVESLSCGTPVVGFGPAVREIRDEMGIEVGVALDTGSPEEIAAAIETVLATDWDRRELRQATLDAFGLDRIADRYVELFSRVASRSDGAAPSAAPPADHRPAPVCVLGMSRTGTSLTTRVLNLAGVYLGPEDELLGGELHHLAGEGEQVLAKARSSNPEGHWEHYRLMRLNERILRSLGGNWRDPPPMAPGWESSEELADLRDEAGAMLAESFGSNVLWGWKDPRNSLTLRFWQRLVPGAMRYVICLRNPLDVASSLQRRDGMSLEEGVELWVAYLSAALLNTSGQPRLLVPYESHFEDPVGTARRLARFVGREGALDGPEAARLLDEAIDERLWRNRTPAREALEADCVSADAASLFLITELLAGAEGAEGGAGEAAGLEAAVDLYAADLAGRLAQARVT